MSASVDDEINVSYTNWRGETKVRRVLLGGIRFGTTEWHAEPTWLISAFDLDHPAQIWKEFDLTKCDFHREYWEVATLELQEENKLLRASISKALDALDLSGFTNSEHAQAKVILRATQAAPISEGAA